MPSNPPLLSKFKKISKGNYLKKDLLNVKDSWDNLIFQTKQNKELLEKKLKKEKCKKNCLQNEDSEKVLNYIPKLQQGQIEANPTC